MFGVENKMSAYSILSEMIQENVKIELIDEYDKKKVVLNEAQWGVS